MSGPLAERRSAEAQRVHRRLWWLSALTSLWAPLTFLALALIPYLPIVGLNEDAAHWAQPAMQGFALAMTVYYGALIVLRVALPGFRQRRRSRHEVAELLAEVETGLRRSTALDPATRERLLAQAVGVDQRRLEGDPEAMSVEARKLVELAEKQLPHFRKSPATDLVSGLVKALVVALLIRAVLIEPYRIPSGSMIPTLEVGDQIFVNKFIYGVRVPFIDWVPFVIVRPPARGDVIVFNNPVNNDDFIKRIAGVPGDVVELKADVVFVNGVEQPREVLDPEYLYWDYAKEAGWYRGRGQLYRERLGKQSHLLLQDGVRLGGAHEGPFTVPPGHVFVMGDNRDHSLDSRYGLGALDRQAVYVPYGNIKGKAMIIWLSLAHGGLGSRLTGGGGLRTDRLFQPVR